MEWRDVVLEVAEKQAQGLADQRHCSSVEKNIYMNDCHKTVLRLVHCP